MAKLDIVWDLLFPPKCPFCGTLLEKGELLCPGCQRDLPWLSGGEGEKPAEFTGGCVSPLRYEEKVRDAIRAYKFSGRSGRSGTFGLLLAQCVVDHGVKADLVTWAPLSGKRLRKRGYDQAELLAKAVAGQLKLPLVRTLDKREIPAQSGLQEEAARRANVLGAYALHPGAEVAGKRILLVDDVVTTGATLSECARILLTAGAEEVNCAALARAR